jgi:hypothetical protein
VGLPLRLIGSAGGTAASLEQRACLALQDLSQALDADVRLGVLGERDVTYIEKPRGRHPVTTFNRGAAVPAHATAMGKALLAFASPSTVDEVIGQGLEQYTPFTLATPSRLRRSLAMTRMTGVAVARREFDLGTSAIAAPVFGGGGAVVAALGALAELEAPVRAVGVIAATENAVGGGSFRPGDILTAMNGKTIEIINTDAEGRLILADALPYARQLGATHLVDLATLTGAMERALGDLYAGVFANDADWRTLVVESGEASGDHAWPWPLHSRYRRYIDSDYADMKNSSIRSQGVPVLAAEFLHEFVGEGPWAHIDMAGTGFQTWPRHDYLSQRGGTGYGVRLICELARRLAE